MRHKFHYLVFSIGILLFGVLSFDLYAQKTSFSPQQSNYSSGKFVEFTARDGRNQSLPLESFFTYNGKIDNEDMNHFLTWSTSKGIGHPDIDDLLLYRSEQYTFQIQLIDRIKSGNLPVRVNAPIDPMREFSPRE